MAENTVTVDVDLNTDSLVEKLDNAAEALREAADKIRDDDDDGYELNVEEHDLLDPETWGVGRVQGENLLDRMKENSHVDESCAGRYLAQRQEGRIVLYEAIDAVEEEQ